MQRQQPGRPGAEGTGERKERAAVVGGMVDEMLPEDDDGREDGAHRGEPQRPDAGPTAHSSSPRRMAAATAAARSDTPSFS